jgi:hypothetical protein
MLKRIILKPLFYFSLLYILISFNHNFAHAVTLTSLINPDSTISSVNYQESHPIQFNYPLNSNLALLFKQLPQRISINASSIDSINENKNNTYAIQNLLNLVNEQFQNKNSIVRATAANVSFIVDIRQFSDTETSVDQRISMDLTLENFVIPNANDPSHKYIDLNWRDFKINDPITLQFTNMNSQSKNTTKIDINHPLSMLYSLNPSFKNEINSNSTDTQILNSPLIDFSKLSLPMDNWYHLFDPAPRLAETKGYGFKGEANGANVVTIYSLGEGSIREGKHEDTTYNVIFGNNRQYKADLIQPAPNGRIDILGYSKIVSSPGGEDTAIISQTNEGGSSYAGNFPFVVLGGLGAMMAVVVVIVLIKSRKTTDITEH